MTAPVASLRAPAAAGAAAEVRKLAAFLRRDFLIAWSYRVAFVSDAFGIAVQVVLFALIGLMVDESVLPTYGAGETTYIEFVALGLVLAVVLSLGLGRVSAAIESERLQGTLESLLLTPTSIFTVQLGSVMYAVLYVPFRTAILIVAATLFFGADYAASGLLPAAVLLVGFVPFVWGLGILSAAAVVAFRRGGGVVGLATVLLTISSGAYFPLSLLPDWIQGAAEGNPLAIVMDGLRQALLGGTGWAGVGSDLLLLAPAAALSLLAGTAAFRLAMGRERRLGTLGLY